MHCTTVYRSVRIKIKSTSKSSFAVTPTPLYFCTSSLSHYNTETINVSPHSSRHHSRDSRLLPLPFLTRPFPRIISCSTRPSARIPISGIPRRFSVCWRSSCFAFAFRTSLSTPSANRTAFAASSVDSPRFLSIHSHCRRLRFSVHLRGRVVPFAYSAGTSPLRNRSLEILTLSALRCRRIPPPVSRQTSCDPSSFPAAFLAPRLRSCLCVSRCCFSRAKE